MQLRSNGRNGPELLEELKTAVERHELKERVQVTHCRIFPKENEGPNISFFPHRFEIATGFLFLGFCSWG